MNTSVALTLSCVMWAIGQAPPPAERATAPAGIFIRPSVPATTPSERLTDAEKIARLQRSIEQAEKEIDDLRRQLESPDSDYAKAQSWFQKNEALLPEKKRALAQAKTKGVAEEIKKAEGELAEVQSKWERSRDRFNLAITERKAIQEKLSLLPQRIEYDRKALAKLLGPSAAKLPTITTVPFCGPPGEGEKPSAHRATPTARPTEPPQQATGNASPKSEPSAPASAQATANAEAPEGESKPSSRKLQNARSDADAKESAAKDASQRAQELSARLEALRKNIDLEQRLLDTALKKTEQLQRSRESLEDEHKRKIAAKAPEAELLRISEILQRVTQRASDTQVEIRSATERLAILQEEMGTLQGEQMAALEEAELKKREAEDAQKVVAELQNPFALRNILQWLFDHGGKILAILAGMLVLHILVRFGSRRFVTFVLCSTQRTERECENRAQTLSTVFRNTSGLLIHGGGVLMLLDTVGIPIVPLMGGAAVMGLAVAFGAQNLIKDYFSGFMVLMEDQYGLNDVVKIGDVVGQVERVTLRVTVLRDQEGTVHFIPHGTIATVSNLTHGWSRAVIEVGVAYREDTDRVVAVLADLGKELRQDTTFGPHILEDLEMLGVDRLADSAVVIKCLLKTRPLKQWQVKREMLRRVKRRFDQIGIEIPFPQQTVYHRVEEGSVVERLEERLRRAA